MADLIGLLYAAAISAGGLIGYAKAGSVPSLVAGLGFGTLAAFSSYYGNSALLLLTSGILAGVMGHRYTTTGKLMPAGIVMILSVAMVVRCLMRTSR